MKICCEFKICETKLNKTHLRIYYTKEIIYKMEEEKNKMSLLNNDKPKLTMRVKMIRKKRSLQLF